MSAKMRSCAGPESLELLFFFSSRRRHTSWPRDWSSDVCSSDLDLLFYHRRHWQDARRRNENSRYAARPHLAIGNYLEVSRAGQAYAAAAAPAGDVIPLDADARGSQIERLGERRLDAVAAYHHIAPAARVHGGASRWSISPGGSRLQPA